MDLADTHGLGRLPDDIPVHLKRLSFQHRFEKGVIILRSLGHSSRRIHLSRELLKSLATVSCRPSNSEISSECQSNAFSSSGKVIIGESQIKSLVERSDSVRSAFNSPYPFRLYTKASTVHIKSAASQGVGALGRLANRKSNNLVPVLHVLMRRRDFG